MGTLNIQTGIFMTFFIDFVVMGRLAENIIFITLKITESYEQSAGRVWLTSAADWIVLEKVCYWN